MLPRSRIEGLLLVVAREGSIRVKLEDLVLGDSVWVWLACEDSLSALRLPHYHMWPSDGRVPRTALWQCIPSLEVIFRITHFGLVVDTHQ